MKKAAIVAIGVAVLSIIMGIIFRLMPQPVEMGPGSEGIKPLSFLFFANTCLLFAIAFTLLDLSKTCKK